MNSNLPHILCLTEHHMKQLELEHLHLENYNLGARYCRKTLEKGGVSIFVHENLKFTKINLEDYCKDQDLEACALKLDSPFSNICILTLYRAPSGNFNHFLNRLETILNVLHSSKVEFIICGDININYLIDSNRKLNLDSLLSSYNLSSTVNFPTRVQNNSSSAIDNIFIDNSKLRDYTVGPFINGLSDHDAQLIEINNIDLQPSNQQYQTVRKINKHTMADFVTKLSNESWDNVFDSNNIDSKFNCFLNTYLRIFYSSFPLKIVKNENKNKSTWITIGIKTSCKHKRQLYLASRDSNDPRLKSHYKMYCKILSKVIKEAKQNNYNSQILKSNNKIKTTWDIVKVESGKKSVNEDVQSLNIEGKSTNNPQAIASAFNEYFLSLAEKTYSNN
ncbi:hypothetical protein B7P43_G06180, partial [Cryptotermes secundus]